MARRKINPPNPKPIAAVTHRRPKQGSMKRVAKVIGVKKSAQKVDGSSNLVRKTLVSMGLNPLIHGAFFTPYEEIIYNYDKRKRCNWKAKNSQ